MSKLIYQCYHPNTVGTKTASVGAYLPIDELAALSQARMKDYADSIGAHYICDTEPYWTGVRAHPAWTRFGIFDKWMDYDELCYVDCDILPTPDAFGVSIFDFEGVGKPTERPAGSKEAWHINAGVFKVTKREAIQLWGEIQKNKYTRMLEATGKNQEAFNQAYKKAIGRKPKALDYRWNATRPYHREGDYYFHHYIGHQKTERGNQWGNLNTNDIYRWNYEQMARGQGLPTTED